MYISVELMVRTVDAHVLANVIAGVIRTGTVDGSL